MSGVPLKAMCSIMCARPVSWSGSCAEPASTRVKNENTGASGRRHRTIVKPLGRVFTETRFSYDARSCAASGKAATSRSRQVNLANQRFIVPPEGRRDNAQVKKLQVRTRKSNGSEQSHCAFQIEFRDCRFRRLHTCSLNRHHFCAAQTRDTIAKETVVDIEGRPLKLSNPN